uniref:SXP/RAL-2 family protein Ani s 5-like cation-binding domain-containing protein n=1 Tax=Strongyloides stercoralis TaxID=6248 RepID=A0A0K0ELT4_STRER
MKLFIFTIILIVLDLTMSHLETEKDLMPKFFKNMSKEGKKKFEKLMKNDIKTKGQIETEINNIIINESDEIKIQFEEMKIKKEKFQNKLKTKFQYITSTFPLEAQNIISKIEQVHNNMNITLKQEMEQIKKIINTVNNEIVKNELEKFQSGIVMELI